VFVGGRVFVQPVELTRHNADWHATAHVRYVCDWFATNALRWAAFRFTHNCLHTSRLPGRFCVRLPLGRFIHSDAPCSAFNGLPSRSTIRTHLQRWPIPRHAFPRTGFAAPVCFVDLRRPQAFFVGLQHVPRFHSLLLFYIRRRYSHRRTGPTPVRVEHSTNPRRFAVTVRHSVPNLFRTGWILCSSTLWTVPCQPTNTSRPCAILFSLIFTPPSIPTHGRMLHRIHGTATWHSFPRSLFHALPFV